MVEPTQFIFSHKELTEILIRHQGIHEGLWTVAFQLGMGNTQAPSPTGGGDTVPAVVVSILGVGLQKTEKETPSTVDASKVKK